MDEDLEALSKDELIALMKQTRTLIREHRDASGHDLCWHQPELWATLPESKDIAREVPEWPQFMRGCIKYRESLDETGAELKRVCKEYKEK